MAEENVLAPTRSDEDILPFNAWLPVGKGNLLLDLQKLQRILSSASRLNYPEHKFLQSIHYINEQWFTLNVDLLGKALEITPVDSAHSFESPLAGKTSGNDKLTHHVLQILWGIITRTNVDYAELLWEEFVQAIQTFFTQRANLNIPTKKPTPHVIPYCQFTKLIIYYLGSKHNIHRRTVSPDHVTGDDFLLEYYEKYMVMAARKPRQVTIVTNEEARKKKTVPSAAPVGRVAIRKPASWITQRLLVVEDKGKGIATDEQAAQSLLDLQKLKKKNAKTDADTKKYNSEEYIEILNVNEEQGEDVSNTVALEERTFELDEGQAGSYPGKTPESRPPLEEDQVGSNPEQSHVVLAGPNPEPMHKDFIVTIYPQIHESLKLTIDEQNPPSLSGTLSSIKNMDDAFTFGDQFLNDKPTEKEPAPSLSTPIINLTPPKPVSSPAQAPVFIATTATTITTTLTLSSPLPQQSTTNLVLATRVSALEKICADFEKKHKLQDKTTQALSSRVFTLENHDMYLKIDDYVNESVKEVIHSAIQALIRERFRELSGFKMKEILRDLMFKSGSYITHFEHTALYGALKSSMDRENWEEFIEATAKSCKRRLNDQDPPLPRPKDSNQSKKKRHDSDVSASKQPPFIDDVPIPNNVHFSDLEDTGATHLLNIKTRPDWLKPVTEEETSKTPEPDWVVPLNDLPEAENNWANAISKTYKDLEENKLL
nr:hypothetical protein [Tanacetum cinerariifolium]